MKVFRCASLLLIAALGLVPGAWAQGCVLCYTSVAAGGPTAMRAFEVAMFALLIPALLLFGGVFLLIFRGARTKSTIRSASRVPSYRLRVAPAANPIEGQA